MKPELLSPAGSYDAALAAFQYGADAIYLGLPAFSARAEAENISMDELRVICAFAKSFSPVKKIYITFNTLLHDRELENAFKMLDQLEEFQPDGVIVQDLGVARMIRKHFPSLILHASTQMAAHNLDSVLALKDLGFKRVVPARELSLAEISDIVDKCDLEIEIFVHGALCYSYSGLCLFSAQSTGRSGNRGRCAYCCRHPFTHASKKGHPFSMKDMALLPVLDKVVATGVHSLKIEGRMKSPLYVACVTNAYRRKLDGTLSMEDERAVTEEIQTIFSRPWTQLYTESTDQPAQSIVDSQTVGHRGTLIGSVAAIFFDENNNKRLRFRTSRALQKFDGIQIDIEESARPFGFSIRNMRRHGEKRDRTELPADTDVEIEISGDTPPHIEKGSKIYCSSSQDVQNRYRVTKLRPSELDKGTGIDITVSLESEQITMQARLAHAGIEISHSYPVDLETAKNPDRTEEAVRKACARLGETNWRLNTLSLNDPYQLYVPPAVLNLVRRELIRKLDADHDLREEHRFLDYHNSLSRHKTTAQAATGSVPEYTLKMHLGMSLPEREEECSRIVVEIDHRAGKEILKELHALKESLQDHQELILSTPLITRMNHAETLKNSISTLIADGYAIWETASLSGYNMLKAAGVTPVSADWPLYCLNRESSAQLKSMGFQTHVTSPETNLVKLYPIAENCCIPELLIYQRTPLYISATAPLSGNQIDSEHISLNGEKGMNCVVEKYGDEWVTTSCKPLDRSDEIEWALRIGINRFRIDYSWHPRLRHL